MKNSKNTLFIGVDNIMHLKRVIPKVSVPHQVVIVDGSLPPLKAGDVLLIMGVKILKVLQTAGLVPKNRTIGSLRGHPIKYQGGFILPTYGAGVINIDYARVPDIQWDVRLAERLTKTGSINPDTKGLKYQYVKSFHKAVEAIRVQYESTHKAVPISIDLETVGLDPYAEGVFIVSISLTYKKNQADVIRFKSGTDSKQPAKIAGFSDTGTLVQEINGFLGNQIEWLSKTKMVKVYGANFKFDMGWMEVHWGIKGWRSFMMDTTLVGSLLNENRSNSLELHAKLFTEGGGYDSHLNATYDKSRMDLIPDDDLLTYAAGDTNYGLQVAGSLRSGLIKEKRLRRFYSKLVHPVANAVSVMEQRGIVVDADQYEVVRGQVQNALDGTSDQLFSLMSGRLKAKYSDNLSLTRPNLLRDYLFTPKGLNLKPLLKTPKGQISTSMEHLNMLAEHHEAVLPFVNSLREYNSAAKTMSTYIVGFLKHIRRDGKFHPAYMLHKGAYDGGSGDAGTDTGRSSARDPAYQCQKADASVLTLTGYKSLRDVIENFNAGTPDMVLTHEGTWKQVIGAYDNGKAPVYRVRTRTGKIIEATGNHPLICVTGKTPIAELTITDKVFVTTQLSSPPNGDVSDLRGAHAIQANEAGFYADTLVSVDLVGIHHTYGITIQDSHTYISGGVVCSNTIPKHTIWAKPLRSVYVPPKGMSILNVDYSTGELRIAACVAQEPTMINAFRSGIDLHLLSGSRMAGYTWDEVQEMKKIAKTDKDMAVKLAVMRQRGKPVNFGLIYGMSSGGLQTYSKTAFGVDMTSEDSAHGRAVYFETYPELLKWHARYKQMAHKQGYVESPLGRVRHLPLIHSSFQDVVAKAERNSINSPIQATLSDLGLWSIAELYRIYPELWVFGFTHDAVSAYVPEGQEMEWACKIRDVMENLPIRKTFGWNPPLKFIVDAEGSRESLADLKEMTMPS